VTAVSAHGLEATLCAYENHHVLDVRLAITRAKEVLARPGPVAKGTLLARGGATTLDGLTPAAFFAQHPSLWAPRTEPVLVVVDVEAHTAQRFDRGALTHEWEVGRGQAEGEKERRGDLKTPRGLYFVTDKSTGPFSGDFAGYYGGHWVKVNYPNAFDAQRGVREGLVTAEQAARITHDWWSRRLTLQKTGLGGGIGFHGWISPWKGDDGFGLSWGCVVFHPEDVAGAYAVLPVGAAVVLE
jgi:hypothetical protein